MNRQMRRKFRKSFEAEQAQQPDRLAPVPSEKWPPTGTTGTAAAIEVWRSRRFLVVLYRDGGFLRMTVNRATMRRAGRFEDEITWDELQQLKREIGRGEQWAVECYPADSELVDVANMRHLWLLDGPPDFAWVRP